ncbi:trophoblast glycoprotein-like [Gadus macrocephalus]|uniref:trophoblast glycoprotein-like n=1 Tax=Gadus macrocephalus TaxID=80720 RepID=UPI0028CBAE23|nr:trophoblast glycoprotein-like [Gadus macrocephalus]
MAGHIGVRMCTFFLLFFFVTLNQCMQCHFGCTCFAATNTVRCVSKDLRAVPLSIPGYARTLIVTGNNIPQIGPDSFPELENVTNICLSNNRITELGSHTFSSMVSLRSLDLSSNPLALIHPEALSIPGSPLLELNLSRALYNSTSLTDLTTAVRWGGLAGLVLLDLSGNRLALLAPAAFSHLPSLRHLLLRHNSLASVRGGAFAGPRRLELLDLSHNAFRAFPAEALGELGRLGEARVRLGGNPYLCSCESRRFAAWLASSAAPRVEDAEDVRCASPRELRDAPLSGVGARAVRCGVPVRGVAAGEASLQTSYAFLGLVLGFVGTVSVLVLYLNRKGMKRWVAETREACRDVLAGYHYRYEIDTDPRRGPASDGDGVGVGRFGAAPPPRITSDTRAGAQMPADVRLKGWVMAPGN